jgi:transposase-like protein
MIDFGKFNSLFDFVNYFNSEERCIRAIREARWGNGEAVCPYCGCTHTYECSNGKFACSHCQKTFSVTVGTIFENTKLSLAKWFLAMYLISSHKKGISSCQLARDIKVTQKTAWFMLQKVRSLYAQDDSEALEGDVEMDEMYLGGRETNKHEDKRTEGTQGRSTKTKTPIFGMIQRGGNIVATKVEDSKGATLMPIVEQFIAEGTHIYTDEGAMYVKLASMGFVHDIVNHKAKEYVRANDIHTNSIEGFWAHFKRVIFSTYHMVSKDYLQRYIDEQVFRWNTREEQPSERFSMMFEKAVKSFKYADVLRMSTSVNVMLWKMKHDIYYHMKYGRA